MDVPEFVRPPQEARHYYPPDDVRLIGENEKSVRFIFYKTEFTAFELQTLAKFEKRLASRQGKLPPYMTKEELLRMLHARRFDMKKAEDCVLNYINWRETAIPQGCLSIYPKIEHLLSTGAIYIHGQDHRYRPLVVFNLERTMRTISEIEDIVNLLCFTLQFIVEYMLVPGQIENWNILTDLCNQNLMKLPIGKLKRVMMVMTSAFRCRVITNFVINSPSSLMWMWGTASRFLDEQTKKKIQFFGDLPDTLFDTFNPAQIEVKYGGLAPDVTEFWPPTIVGPPYNSKHEPERAFLTSLRESSEMTPNPGRKWSIEFDDVEPHFEEPSNSSFAHKAVDQAHPQEKPAEVPIEDLPSAYMNVEIDREYIQPSVYCTPACRSCNLF